MAVALALVAGGPFRLDTVVLDLEATLGLTEAEDVDAEELLFLVLDVFKCIGPVLEVLSLFPAEAAAAVAAAAQWRAGQWPSWRLRQRFVARWLWGKIWAFHESTFSKDV